MRIGPRTTARTSSHTRVTAPLTTAGGGTQNATNFSGAGVTLTNAITANSLKLTGGTLTLGAKNVTLNGTNGGILTTGTTTIDTTGGGILSAGAGNELILAGSGLLGISGNNLIGNNAGSLTKIGPGGLIISGANSYIGGTTLNSGTVQLGNSSALGSGAITLRGALISSFQSTVDITLTNNVITMANTIGSLTSVVKNLTLSGAVTGGGSISMAQTNSATASSLSLNGDLSQFTGTLMVTTQGAGTNSPNMNIGGSTSASQNNMGQATLQMLGITTPTRRLQGWTGVMQVVALQSAVGAGAFSNLNQTMQVGALNTNTSFGGAIAAAATNLTKVGTGSLTLNGNTTYNAGGSLNANGGRLPST